jgi:hypothetical protein
MKKNIAYFSVAVLILVQIFFVTLDFASANNTAYQITPSLLELEMKKGETREFPITIKQSQDQNYNYQIGYIESPIASRIPNQEYKLNIISDNIDPLSSNNWIEIIENKGYFICVIRIPENAKTGSYFPIITFKPIPASIPVAISETFSDENIELIEEINQNNSLNLNIELTTQLYINVIEGSSDYKIVIDTINPNRENILEFPKEVTVTVKNEGGTFAYPRGAVSMTYPNGTYSNSIGYLNKDYQLLLPNSTSNYYIENVESASNSIIKSGKYKLNATIYSNASQDSKHSKEIEFLYINPAELISGIVILVISAILSVFAFKRFKKKAA